MRSNLQDTGRMINKSNNINTSLSLQSCLGGTRFVKVENLGRFAKVKQLYAKISLMKENYWEKWVHFFIMINLLQTCSHYVPTTEVFFLITIARSFRTGCRNSFYSHKIQHLYTFKRAIWIVSHYLLLQRTTNKGHKKMKYASVTQSWQFHFVTMS